MLIMKKEEAQQEVEKINEYLGKCLWMDFEFCRMNSSQVVMAGSIDQSCNEYAIDIEFEQPHFVSSLFDWQTDTSKPVIQMIDKLEVPELGINFQAGKADYIFKINVEDSWNPPIFIVAKKITCKILNENPFPD